MRRFKMVFHVEDEAGREVFRKSETMLDFTDEDVAAARIVPELKTIMDAIDRKDPRRWARAFYDHARAKSRFDALVDACGIIIGRVIRAPIMAAICEKEPADAA